MRDAAVRKALSGRSGADSTRLLRRMPFQNRSLESLVVLAVALACTLGCGAGTAGPSGSPAAEATAPTEPEDPRLAGVLSAHNQVRAGATPAPATPLRPLAWSEDDAQVARAYAEKCTFAHNPNRGPRGENLYAATASTPIADVVTSWAGEAASYDYASGKCSGMCGHYTQLVWADTTHVGCAVKACTTNSPFSGRASWELWVCNYSPPGNFVGKKPY